jgi:hypothetical protein
MQFSGKFNEADFDDFRKMTTSGSYWPNILLENCWGIAIILAILWLTILGLLGETNPDWLVLSLIWAAVAVILAWKFYRTKRMQTWDFEEMNARVPDQLNFTYDGLEWRGPLGRTGFVPWANFKTWREGNRVVLLEEFQVGQFVILPVQHFSEPERVLIRQTLVKHVSATVDKP